MSAAYYVIGRACSQAASSICLIISVIFRCCSNGNRSTLEIRFLFRGPKTTYWPRRKTNKHPPKNNNKRNPYPKWRCLLSPAISGENPASSELGALNAEMQIGSGYQATPNWWFRWVDFQDGDKDKLLRYGTRWDFQDGFQGVSHPRGGLDWWDLESKWLEGIPKVQHETKPPKLGKVIWGLINIPFGAPKSPWVTFPTQWLKYQNPMVIP